MMILKIMKLTDMPRSVSTSYLHVHIYTVQASTSVKSIPSGMHSHKQANNAEHSLFLNVPVLIDHEGPSIKFHDYDIKNVCYHSSRKCCTIDLAIFFSLER